MVRSRVTLASLVGWVCLSSASVALAGSVPSEQAPIDWKLFQSLWLKDLRRSTPEERILPVYSERKALSFLDGVALKWTRQNRCGTCHTTIAYLMARPQAGGPVNQAALTEVRSTVSAFASYEAAKQTDISTIIAGAAVAAFTVGDAARGRPLQRDTRELFDFLWKSQESNGSWVVRAEGLLPFLERDPRYLALLVALAVGYAPDRYYDDPSARTGFAKLRGYLHDNPPENVHEKAVLLWASVRTPGLLSSEQQADYERSLLALQKPDGGWSLASMGSWPRHDGAPNSPTSASDGYATSLAALALCQRGYTVKAAPVQHAVTWIQHHQRVSGRWYTRSMFSDGFQNYLSNMGTAYAVMALGSCAAKHPDGPLAPTVSSATTSSTR